MAYTLSLLNRQGIPALLQGVETRGQWLEKRDSVRRAWLSYIGELPPRVPVNVRVRSESKEPGHTRHHIEYDTVYGDTITAYLLIPDGAETSGAASKQIPAILALHPTQEMGKDNIATPQGKKNRMYALELVQRGYVVLAPDALTAGERIEPGGAAFHSGLFYERHPEWSTVAKNITDHMQSVDVLCSLDVVNPHAVGAIGHSFGGYNSYFLAGMDDRIKAVVSSCGFSPFTGDPHPEHWGYRSYPYTHIPKMSADLQQDRIPFEFHEIAALCAPVPFFNYAGQADHIFPHWKSVAEGMLEVSGLYGWLGEEDRFKFYMSAGGHDFPGEIRELAYSFLDRWLIHAIKEETGR
ncbi:Alpha/beta hydrolase family protein [Paenibacillus sp. UNCCL117]|uniref:dienelactone hydrolase family protein n=1 Tax=unclassified Paenibacillus TaxID=185978 RepID=UPI0008876826|nr:MULTISPECIES: dienelactone hydrolase family protein [unclassified Paenibacillus]SDE44809.1 Alpha/beta hydrolase family protein [Paenibacillus sp. cl123]SFW46360.1 Alpha/beta hydrolase family protein [Paenibacillus sp. UNCCL117]